MAKADYFKIMSEIAKIAGTDVDGSDDFDDRSKQEITKRDEEYSNLLKHFVSITCRRNEAKEENKWIFFRIIMGLLITLGLLACATIIVLLIKCSGEENVSYCTACLHR